MNWFSSLYNVDSVSPKVHFSISIVDIPNIRNPSFYFSFKVFVC